MAPEEAILGVVVAVAVIVPTIAISARLAIKPVVDAIVRLRESAASVDTAATNARFARIEGQIAEIAGLRGKQATLPDRATPPTAESSE